MYAHFHLETAIETRLAIATHLLGHLIDKDHHFSIACRLPATRHAIELADLLIEECAATAQADPECSPPTAAPSALSCQGIERAAIKSAKAKFGTSLDREVGNFNASSWFRRPGTASPVCGSDRPTLH